MQNELTFTIDSSSAKALDDAISVKKIDNDCYRVSIHISDVASHFKSGSPLDKEALKRAETNFVIKTFNMPMLPREISSEVCSLL